MIFVRTNTEERNESIIIMVVGRFVGPGRHVNGRLTRPRTAIAIRLGENGAKVICVARNADKLTETVNQIKAAGGDAVAISCDVTDRAAIEKLFRTSGNGIQAIRYSR